MHFPVELDRAEEIGKLREIIDDARLAWESRGRLQCLDHTRNAIRVVRNVNAARDTGARHDVGEYAGPSPVDRSLDDLIEHWSERFVVEDAAVDQPARDVEVDDAFEVGALSAAALADIGEDGLERCGEGRGGARGAGEPAGGRRACELIARRPGFAIAVV